MPNFRFSRYLFLPVLSGSILICGCGPYRLGTTLPGHLQTVFVPTFKNKTPQTGMEIDVTNAVISRFRIDGNLRPVSEAEADTVLRGEITGWRRVVLGYEEDEEGEEEEEVEEYRLYVVATINFINRHTSEVLIPWEDVRGYTDFEVGDSLPESEEAARPDAFKDLARRIVDKVISVW